MPALTSGDHYQTEAEKIAAFITARLDEDETLINERTRHLAQPSSELLEQFGDFGDDERWMVEMPVSRLTAEIGAKRIIVQACLDIERQTLDNNLWGMTEHETILVALASAWREHPDYDHRWEDQ